MASPSEFLTFFRRSALRTANTTSLVRAPVVASRPFSATLASQKKANDQVATEEFPDNEHATRKKDKLDVQSEQSAKGREGKEQDVGGHAVREKDERNSQQKAKEEFPESPVQIGMQDERGGKGA